MGLLSFTFAALLAVAGVHSAALTLQSPRFEITGPTANQLRAGAIVAGQDNLLTLGNADVLKVMFTVTESAEGKGVQPHQAFLRFYDPTSGEEGIQPVRVTQGGKAKFELNMARPPASLPPTASEPLHVSLLLGSFEHSPAQYELFKLSVPASAPPPQHPDEASFHVRPTIVHTFRPEQKVPPRPVSAFFAASVFTPWVVLLGLWSQIRLRVPHLLSPSILPFIATLGAFEVLLFWYWVNLQLGDVLLYGGILSVFTTLAGKQALSSVGEWRVGRK